jgi:NAD-dependent deacetylase
VLTGAGISAESGIPTFRDAGGLWKNFRAEDLATPQAFARDPKLVWEWYDWRRSLIAKAEPNRGHHALADLEKRTANFTLITQNVDGLHDRAGATHLLKVHGDIWTLRCTLCGKERHDARPSFPDLPPRCSCGAIERPASFGSAKVFRPKSGHNLSRLPLQPMCFWWSELRRWSTRRRDSCISPRLRALK